MSKGNNIGVVNPYALAELVIGRPIRWNRISDRRSYLEIALQTPIDKLFDPMHGSVLYPRLQVQKDGTVKPLRRESAEASVERMKIPGVPRQATFEKNFSFTLNPDHVRRTMLGLLSRLKLQHGWEPRDADWMDKGDFFEEGCEFGDPLQGALADCYLIAAMGAVAWTRPYAIAHRTRQIGPHQETFVDRVDLYRSKQWNTVEVTERVPVSKNGHAWKFARSTEPGEIWPAVIEKAYAKLKSGTATDRPDYNVVAYGSSVAACRLLIGGTIHSLHTETSSADDLWTFVASHSAARRTFNPMVAWTYGSAKAAPDNITYDGASGIASNHAYTVLGWENRNDIKYIVLRNPWGDYTPATNNLSGSWIAYDQTYYLTVPYDINGVFAFKASEFKKYFAGIGYAA